MPQFMVLIQDAQADDAQLAPAKTREFIEAHAAYEERLRAANAFLDGERLRPSTEGRRVRHRNGEARVQVGPFAEAPLTGYYLIEAPTLEAAIELADACPRSAGAALDVRPLMKGQIQPDKSSQQGRVFAFGVLGNAPNEAAWVDVMNAIDESSREGLPAARRLGGVRLEAPGKGRGVRNVGGHRTVFDGPFLESKEVIGGLFFLRMDSLDDAVHWASGTAFVKLGAVEIRELWRSLVAPSTTSSAARNPGSWARWCACSAASTPPRRHFKRPCSPPSPPGASTGHLTIPPRGSRPPRRTTHATPPAIAASSTPKPLC